MNVVQRSRQRMSNLAGQQRPSGWFRMAAGDGGAPTRVDIYDEIGGGGWFDTGVTAIDFIQQLAGINGDIEVHINSPGGDVFDGLAIYNSLAQRSGNVTTVVDGLAASAASFIAMAGKQRIIAPGAMMMIHDASGMCIGNSADMRELAELLDKVSDNIASIYADHDASNSGTDWRAAMKAETWYTADEAVAAGLAHRLAERPAASALAAAAKFDLSAYFNAPTMAAAAPGHGPFTGTHTHAHTAAGDQGDDATHEHEHSHDGDADHGHSHTATKTEDRATGGRVLGIESMPLLDKAMPIHHTATEDSAWDGPAAVAAMPADDKVLRYCHAWMSDEAAAEKPEQGDDDADDQKSSYKFPHHRTDGGPANLAACRNGLARLAGADIPDGDRTGVKAHLQAHLDDASKGDGERTTDHAGPPSWLQNAASHPAWLDLAEEAK